MSEAEISPPQDDSTTVHVCLFDFNLSTNDWNNGVANDVLSLLALLLPFLLLVWVALVLSPSKMAPLREAAIEFDAMYRFADDNGGADEK
mmetsp:Transcript_15735/g.31958  ORF Transcript_15735/g.31958 Transcript_15735/m.31958 type:complete len:90 (-) Transcript_15735:241-510(-)